MVACGFLRPLRCLWLSLRTTAFPAPVLPQRAPRAGRCTDETSLLSAAMGCHVASASFRSPLRRSWPN